MEIVKYESKYKKAFKEMSINWIEKFFSIESEDIRTIDNIELLIDEGAMVFFAVKNGIVLSTCMIRPLEKDVWEIGKLSTNENYLGNGAGSKVFEACINYAREHDAKKIVLFSHTSLQPAIHIYIKFNFREVPVTNTEYTRCNYQAELLL